MNVQIWGK